LVAGLIALLYLPALKHDFVNWDDPLLVVNNHSIRSLSPAGIARLFSSFHVGHYHPLTMLTYAVEWRWWGPSPAVYHATNLLIHVINALLALGLVFLWSKNLWVAVFSALLFGIHPLHVESVAWVAERKDVLYSSFYLGALLSYGFFLRTTRRRFYYLCLILFLLSLLSKVMAVTFPLVLLWMDRSARPSTLKNAWAEKTPFFLLCFLAVTVNLFAEYRTWAPSVLSDGPRWVDRFFLPSYSVLFQWMKTLLPFNLSCLYPYPDRISVSYIGSPVVLALVLGMVWRVRHRFPPALFGTGFFLIVFLPVSQLLPLPDISVTNDRYHYLASLGLFYAGGELLRLLWGGPPRLYWRRGIFLFVALWVVGLGILTHRRTAVWRDSLSLWNDVLSKYPATPFAYNNRGLYFYQNGEDSQAEADFRRVLVLNPYHVEAWNNRGLLQLRRKEYRTAIFSFNRALRLRPDFVQALHNRGVARLDSGYLEEALTDFDRVIALDPEDGEAYYNRGNLYQRMGLKDKAIEDYGKAICLKPDYGHAYNNRAIVYFSMGDVNGARNDVRQALKLGLPVSPDFLRVLEI